MEDKPVNKVGCDNPKNLISLKEYVDLRFNQAEIAITKTEQAMTDRFASVNEFRGTLKDQVSTFPSRIELKSEVGGICDRITRIENDIKTLQLSQANLAGKASQTSVNFSYLISIVSILMGIISLFFKFA